MESGSGPGGRRFKSSLPDHSIFCHLKSLQTLVQNSPHRAGEFERRLLRAYGSVCYCSFKDLPLPVRGVGWPADAPLQQLGLLTFAADPVVPVYEGAVWVTAPGPDVQLEEWRNAIPVGATHELKGLAFQH